MAYEQDVRVPSFAGLMQYGDGIGGDMRNAVEAGNVDTPGGVLQPMAACTPITYTPIYGWTRAVPFGAASLVGGSGGPASAPSLDVSFGDPPPPYGIKQVTHKGLSYVIKSGESYTVTFLGHAGAYAVNGDTTMALSFHTFTVTDTLGAWSLYSSDTVAESDMTLTILSILFDSYEAFSFSGLTLVGLKSFPSVLLGPQTTPVPDLPVKAETIAVLHRRWYAGADASPDVLIAAAGGVLYWMLVGGTAWTPLGHPDVGAIKNGSWLEGVDVDWETLTVMGATIELSSDYPLNNKQTLKMALDAGEVLGTIKQTITLPAPIPAPLTATLSFQYHIDADSLAAYTNGVIGEPEINPVIITYAGVDGADESVTAADLSSGADWSLHTKQLTIPAGATEISLMFAVVTVSEAAMTVYFSDVQLLTPFYSSTWSWVQYEIAPASPEDDPIDVLVLSNQDDGMIYIRCDDTTKAITKVTTPKNFGVIARYNERIWGGDIAEDPDMVVYSAPYDFTDWAQNTEIPEDGAGDIQQPTWDGDSFTALKQLGPQLVAFRRNTVWRILGTDPGEFAWKQQYGGGTAYENTIVVDGERVLMLGNSGLLQYDGLGIAPYYQEYCQDFWATLNIAALEQACACLYKHKYYLSVPTGTSVTNNSVVIFDTREKTWLLRTDVTVEAWLPTEAGLYFTNVATPGRVYLWGEDAWTSGTAATPCKWISPWVDLGRKDIRKGGWVVYLTVEGYSAGTLSVSIETEKKKKTKTYSYPELGTHAKQKRMSFGGSGRRFRLHIESSGTTVWRLIGGIQIATELDPD